MLDAIALRNELAEFTFSRVDPGSPPDIVEAAAALFGATAILIACLPDNDREKTVERLAGDLAKHVAQRRSEIVREFSLSSVSARH